MDGSRSRERGARRRGRGRRWGSRALVAALLALALGWFAYRAFFPRYLESRLIAALRAAGFPQAALHVRRAGLGGAELVDISLWPGARAASASLVYSVGDLIRGRIEGVRLRGAELTLPLSADELAALPYEKPAGGSSGGPPLRWLVLEDIRVRLVRADWTAEMALAGRAVSTGERIDFAAHGTAMGALVALVGSAQSGHESGVRLTLAAGRPDGWLTGGAVYRPSGLQATLAAAGEAGRLEVAARSRGPSDELGVDWRLDGPVPHRALVAAGLELEGDHLAATGHAVWRPSSSRLTLAGCDLAVSARRAVRGAVTIDEPRAALRLSGELAPDRHELRLEDGSAIRIGGIRVGRGARALSIGPLDGDAAAPGGPFLVHQGGATRIEAALSPRGPVALAGAIRGRLERVRVDLSAVFGGSQDSGELHLGADSRALRLPGRSLALERVRLRLPVGWGGRRPTGSARATLVARGRHLGRARSAITWRAGSLSLDGSLDLPGGAQVAATGGVETGPPGVRARFHLAMPPTRLDLARLVIPGWRQPPTGSAIVSLRGDLDLTPVRRHGSLRIEVEGGRLALGRRLSVEGVESRVELAELFPPTSRGEQQVWFERGRVGGVPFGRGSLGLLLTAGQPRVRAQVNALGGTVRTSTWTPPPHGGQLGIVLSNIDLAQVLPLVSRRRLKGTGRLDGELAVDIAPGAPRPLRVRSGRLVTRGGGRLTTRSSRLVASLASRARLPLDQALVRLVRERIARALADFDYSRLDLDLAPNRRRDHLTLRADLQGKGHQVPQELSLVLYARGVDLLLDPLLNLSTLHRNHP